MVRAPGGKGTGGGTGTGGRKPPGGGRRGGAPPRGGGRTFGPGRGPERRTTERRTWERRGEERATPERRGDERRTGEARTREPGRTDTYPERRPPSREQIGREKAYRHAQAGRPEGPESPRKPPKPAPRLADLSPTGEAALSYLGRGWSVIPLRPGDKRPLVGWEEYQYRRPTDVVVRGWFRRWPEAGVGIVTGLASGLVVLDVDAAHGGEASLQRLVQSHGELPWTVEARTGGGGRHLYFAHPGGVIHNRAGFRPGLDLRGDGGYVVAPPSLHASGRPYAWAPTGEPGRAEPAALPAWLMQAVSGTGGRLGHSRDHWRKLVAEGVTEGARNETVASLTGHLLFRGVDAEVALELLLAWNRVRCRPPLPDDEVARTVTSITRTHERHGATGGNPAVPDATELDGA